MDDDDGSNHDDNGVGSDTWMPPCISPMIKLPSVSHDMCIYQIMLLCCLILATYHGMKNWGVASLKQALASCKTSSLECSVSVKFFHLKIEYEDFNEAPITLISLLSPM